MVASMSYQVNCYRVADINQSTTVRTLRRAERLAKHWLDTVAATLPPASGYRLQRQSDGYGLCSVAHGCIATTTIRRV